MARYITNLTAGVPVYIDQTINGVTEHKLFIYLGTDTAGNCLCMQESLFDKRRMHSSSYANWAGSEADEWLNDDENGYLSRFDAVTRSAMTYADIKFRSYNVDDSHTAQYATASRRVFLPSRSNMGLSTSDEGASFLEILKGFYDTTAANRARLGNDESGNIADYWIMSGASQTNYWYVTSSGGESSDTATNTEHYLRPIISFDPQTPVSDEGADAIFLFPDGRDMTWTVSAIVNLGKSDKRPNSARLTIPEYNVVSATYEVCNNAGDESPVWVPIKNDGVAKMANSEKTTDKWELGVKINASTSSFDGYVGQPALIVAKDK